MNSIPLAWLFLVLCSTSLFGSNHPTDDYSKGLSQSLQDAKNNNKNIFVNFEAQWCLPCQMFKKNVLADKNISEVLNNEFVALGVDVDNQDQADWNKNYKVSYLPTSLILDPNGEILKQISGHKTINELAEILKPYSTRRSEVVISSAATKAPMKMIKRTALKPSAYNTVTVGAFASKVNVQKYKAKLESKSSFDFFITISDKNLYRLNVGKFISPSEADEILLWLKQNNTDHYVRKLEYKDTKVF